MSSFSLRTTVPRSRAQAAPGLLQYVTGAGVAVLYVGGAVGLEVEGLLPVERDRLHGVDAEEGVLDGPVAHHPGDPLFILPGEVRGSDVHGLVGELLRLLHDLAESHISPEAAAHLDPWEVDELVGVVEEVVSHPEVTHSCQGEPQLELGEPLL